MTTRTETIPLVDDTELAVTVGEPESAAAVRGGIVVLHSSHGVTERTERIVEGLAGEGWLTVAPHLFHREGDPVYGYDDLGAARESVGRLTADGVLADCDHAVAAMGLGWERTAVIGFCVGGAIGFGVATRRDCAAAVTFYGGPVDVVRVPGFAPMVESVGDLRAPWLGLYGARDAMIPIPSIEALGVELVEKGLHPSSYVIFDADHGFHNDDRPDVFDVAAAQDAWEECGDWLHQWVPS